MGTNNKPLRQLQNPNEETLLPFHFMPPEDIDRAIKKFLENKGKSAGGNKKWPADLIQQRHLVVIDYLRQGLSYKRTSEEIMERWGISEQTAYKYINKAVATLADNREEYIAKSRELITERLEGILAECVEQQDHKNALAAIDQLTRLYGVYAPVKQETKIEAPEIKFEFGNIGGTEEK